MQVLYWLESIRTPFMTQLMLLLTHLGEETAFLVAALIVFWCVDKNRGYYLMGVGFCGTILNQFLKLLCKVPRPWVKDPAFNVVEQAKPEATGYSFPSGHSQSAVGTFGALALTSRRRALRWIFASIALIVPFSRLYLGVHTPQDVLVGALSALALIFLMRFVCDGKHIRPMLLAMAGLSVAYLVFAQFILDGTSMDEYNYTHGVENAYTLMGAIFAMVAVAFIDERWVHFPTKAVWWAQILKVAGGLVLVLAVKSGLKAPLNALLGEYIGRAVRYFLVVMVAGIVWPLTFRWFSGLGKVRNTAQRKN